MAPCNTDTFISKRGHAGKHAAFAVLVMGLAMATGRSVLASQAVASQAASSQETTVAPADHPEFPQTPRPRGRSAGLQQVPFA